MNYDHGFNPGDKVVRIQPPNATYAYDAIGAVGSVVRSNDYEVFVDFGEDIRLFSSHTGGHSTWGCDPQSLQPLRNVDITEEL